MATHHRPAVRGGGSAAGLDAVLWKGGAAAADVRVAWRSVGDMEVPRRDHTATLLKGGRVLIVGGWATDVVELFDPHTGIFRSVATTGAMHGAFPTATRLSDGRVLIAGGTKAPTAAEIYDPASHTFTEVQPMNQGRCAHTATRLDDGKVLIVGGQGFPLAECYSSAEIFDPEAGTFTPTAGQLTMGRTLHGAALLRDGRVLIAGGDGMTELPMTAPLTSAEIFDPATGRFEPTAEDMTEAHSGLYWSAPQVLAGGRVLIAGNRVTRGDLFDSMTGTFIQTAPLKIIRGGMSATTVAGRFVVLAGGTTPPAPDAAVVNRVEVYDVSTNTFRLLPHMRQPRCQHTSTLLADDRILVTGGCNDSVASTDARSAEVLTLVPSLHH